MELEYELFVQLRENVSQQVERLQQVAHSVATLDVLQSLATVSARYGYVRPEMTDGLQLTIKGGRHPVVEQVLDDGAFTPNDTVLNPQKEQIALITGPNMAGKSTYMRQVALIVLMAHIGCFVPATKACIPLVDRIFTRIGAADDLVGGQSTFMVEMLETRHAITQATERRSSSSLTRSGEGRPRTTGWRSPTLSLSTSTRMSRPKRCSPPITTN